jgi:hypothetical protein
MLGAAEATDFEATVPTPLSVVQQWVCLLAQQKWARLY